MQRKGGKAFTFRYERILTAIVLMVGLLWDWLLARKPMLMERVKQMWKSRRSITECGSALLITRNNNVKE